MNFPEKESCTLADLDSFPHHETVLNCYLETLADALRLLGRQR